MFHVKDKDTGKYIPKLTEEAARKVTIKDMRNIADELDQDLVKIHNAKLALKSAADIIEAILTFSTD